MRNIRKTIALSGLLAMSTAGLYAKDNLPNIIFILADDMGIGDLGCYGQDRIPTPNIDKLAERGMLFTNHYSGSTVSAPSRCALMTGKHTGRGYVRGNKGVASKHGIFDVHLPEDEITVAKLAQDKGYATMCVGKWGLGGPETTGSPTNQGYDYFFGYLSQANAHRYYPTYLWENDEKYPLDGKTYSHFLIMEKGLKFMEKHIDQPIFAYFAITPPHADLDYPDISKFAGKFEETPYEQKKPGKGYLTQLNPRATYAAMVNEVDHNVGQIVDMLEKAGKLENSIIIFSSDNGVHNVGGHDPEFFNSNMGLRGWKRDLYEGGIRTPFIVQWPAEIKAGSSTDHRSTFWDFLPTVADIIDVDKPEDCDGISYLPTLKGKRNQKGHEYLYYEFFEQGGRQCVIEGDWKLVRLNVSKKANTKEELYNLKYDPKEKNNVISSEPTIAAKLRKTMDNARTESEIYKF